MSLEACVEQALSLIPEATQARFATDPLGAIREDLGLTATAVNHLAGTRAEGGACDGVSFLQDGVVLYAPTPHSRRENFTLAHEAGHWLVDQTSGIYDWLAEQPDPPKLLETVCDRIAQRLLLPEAAAQTIVRDGPIRARHLIELYDATQASRPVCAIALAKHLPGLGAIAIIDRYTRSVTHASIKPDPHRGWPAVFPWPQQQLTDEHPLLALAPGKSTSRRLPWRTPWGATADFYIDAMGDDKRVLAVLCSRDLWDAARFHPNAPREFDTRPLLSGYCCGSAFERRGYPCPECSGAFCPHCEDCPCARQTKREIQCTACFIQYQPHIMIDGLCASCRE
ncbi:hypothetical protein GCM10022377_00290 [Zhihengliuella alba]|uniref:IrrE N-terminal-like domain-containing protein n=1 Tax=Zhihengliuella alba TaxID=547018 RepID=A0ABP7CN01_9MICC